MTKELQEKLTNIAALVTAVVALGATLKGLREGMQGAATEVWKNWPWYVVPAVVFLAILLWRRDRLVRWLNLRSTVSRRDAFHIGRKYLLGREEDVERLLRILAEWPLVFLIGESGAGKSSLLERGVLPRLKEVPGQLPLLIDTWGPDWIEGPCEALAQALQAALDESLRKLLGIEGPVTPSEALAVVGCLRSKAARTPLFLFDQVDDYQTRHLDRFLGGPEHTLLTAKALVVENPFWRAVADLLKNGEIRCLFTIRSDAKIGLESVRFQEPKFYPLDPLEKSAAVDLLSEIAKQAVARPEKGFDQLAERLLNDLAADGLVLPIQMQVAFSGLAELPDLSVGEYERQGGLPGLEALHLESRISAAARSVEIPAADVRGVLISMVDRATRKTVPQPTENLSTNEPSMLMDLLEKLEMDKVVRRRIAPGGEGSVWLLDHDYLSRGVLELDRRAQRWPRELEEAVRSYGSAEGIWDHWKKLLPPPLQFRLFYEWFRRRLRYGSAGAYARVSTIRILVWLFIPLLPWLVWNLFSVQRKAERLFAEFGERQMTTGELQALWSLSGEDRRLRRTFLDTALAHAPNARRFNARGERIIHAANGFREEDRDYVLENIVSSKCMPEDPKRPSMDPIMIDACTVVIQQMAVPPEDLKRVLRSWVRVAKSVQVLYNVKWIMNSYPRLVDPELEQVLSRKAFGFYENVSAPMSEETWYLLVPKDRRQLAQRVLERVRANDIDARFATIYGFRELGDVLTPRERVEVAKYIISRLEVGAGGQDVSQLRNVVGGISGKEARRILELVLAIEINSKENTRDDFWLWSTLMDALDSAEAKAVLGYYVATTGKPAVEESFKRFIIAPDSRVGKLSSYDAVSLLQIILEKYENTSDLVLRGKLIGLLEAVGNRLSLSDVEEVSRYLLEAMKQEARLSSLPRISLVLSVLGERIPSGVGAEMTRLLLARLEKAEGQEKRIVLSRLSNMGSSLEPSARDLVIQHLIEEMRKSNGLWAGDLSRLSFMMSDDRVREVADLIINLKGMGASLGSPQLIESLGPRLNQKERQQVLESLLGKIEENPSNLRWVNRALVSLSENAPPEFTRPALQKWLNKKRLSTFPDCAEVVPLIRDPMDPLVMELLKWPTCTARARNDLISKLDDLVPDEAFGFKDDNGQYHADIWGKFLPWVRKQELDLESPPILPDLALLDAERLDG